MNPIIKHHQQMLVPVSTMPVGSIEAYISRVNAIPMLDKEEELSLSARLRDGNDIEAAQKLIMSHLRFVVKIARGFSGYGLPLSDLIQEGNVGLMKAVKRFNPKVGVRLVSYAVHWIKAEMHEYIIKNWRIVKVATTKAQRKLFFNLRNSRKRLGWLSQDEINDVAKTLKVKPAEVIQMESRMNAYDASFDADSSDDENTFAPSAYLSASDLSPEEIVLNSSSQDFAKQQLTEALTQLDGRSLAIVKARWLSDEKPTLHALAAKYSVSAERIRQIETEAMQMLRKSMASVA